MNLAKPMKSGKTTGASKSNGTSKASEANGPGKASEANRTNENDGAHETCVPSGTGNNLTAGNSPFDSANHKPHHNIKDQIPEKNCSNKAPGN